MRIQEAQKHMDPSDPDPDSDSDPQHSFPAYPPPKLLSCFPSSQTSLPALATFPPASCPRGGGGGGILFWRAGQEVPPLESDDEHHCIIDIKKYPNPPPFEKDFV